MQLRDYQSALADSVAASLAQKGSVVLQLPTGGGKTHIAATIAQSARKRGKRIWFVCHRREIVQQTSRALEDYGVSHGVVAAGYERWDHWQVQVCSIGSLIRARRTLPVPDLIVWDECHHVAAPSWSAIKASYPKARHLGLTATPERLDGIGLGAWFDELICGPSTRDLIAAGHLSPYRMFAPTIPDLSGVKVRAGDYAKEQLGEAMSGHALVGDVVDHYKRLAPNARAIAFAASVKASIATVERFNAAGIPARHVDGNTPADARDAAIGALQAGEIKVLSNVEVFTEGFDLPAIDAVILLRPTKSLALYRQMIGRGLRTADGKTSTIILDHAALVHEHGMPDEETTWSLDSKGIVGADGDRETRTRLRRCPECSAVHPFAVECSECGHVYTVADRSIDEVYGHLHEVSAPAGHEAAHAFARRIGVSGGTRVRSMVKRGMPCSPSGFIPVADALAWLNSQRSSANQPPWGSAPGEYEPRQKFGARFGLSKDAVKRCLRRGMPCALNGWVHVADANKWLSENENEQEQYAHKMMGDSQKQFAKRCSVRLHTVTTWKKKGLPQHPDGSIDVEHGLAWVGAHPPTGRQSQRSGHETLKAFCRRIGVSETGGKRSLKARGIPLTPRGDVHIEAGLEWVRANGVARRREGRVRIEPAAIQPAVS